MLPLSTSGEVIIVYFSVLWIFYIVLILCYNRKLASYPLFYNLKKLLVRIKQRSNISLFPICNLKFLCLQISLGLSNCNVKEIFIKENNYFFPFEIKFFRKWSQMNSSIDLKKTVSNTELANTSTSTIRLGDLSL